MEECPVSAEEPDILRSHLVSLGESQQRIAEELATLDAIKGKLTVKQKNRYEELTYLQSDMFRMWLNAESRLNMIERYLQTCREQQERSAEIAASNPSIRWINV